MFPWQSTPHIEHGSLQVDLFTTGSLSICLSVCLPLCLSFFVSLALALFVLLLSVSLPLCPSLCLCVCVSLSLPICLSLSLYISVSVSLFVSLSLFLSLSLSLSHPHTISLLFRPALLEMYQYCPLLKECCNQKRGGASLLVMELTAFGSYLLPPSSAWPILTWQRLASNLFVEAVWEQNVCHLYRQESNKSSLRKKFYCMSISAKLIYKVRNCIL